ncbi:MAG: DUF1624 domain-containing protein [Rhodoferax sp.]|nr:DUF1624 domain-containing protein [Rhodoferax sp.]
MSGRLDALDALRAFALVWMALYHFAFDLNNFGLIHQDFYRDPNWTLQRTAVLSLFLFCAGFGQALAWRGGQRWPRFWRRWSMIAGCAVLVSAGSWLMFPGSFIYFGVLHGMAVMLVLARLTAGWGAWCLAPAALALAAPSLAAPWLQASGWADGFNAPAMNWLGLITRKPVTEDYVPVLPWMGVVWIGVAAASLWHGAGAPGAGWRMRSATGRAATWLGRRSLLFYMVHQPVLIGALWLYTAAAR